VASPPCWKCGKCNRKSDFVSGFWVARHGKPTPTGRIEKKWLGTRGYNRHPATVVEYKCGECGHVGWSKLGQALRKFREVFPEKEILT